MPAFFDGPAAAGRRRDDRAGAERPGTRRGGGAEACGRATGARAPGAELLGPRRRVPRHAVAPTLVFDLEVDDPSGRQVFTISLTVQIAIEPAQRRYDEETRERLIELLGEPGRIGSPTRTMPLDAGRRAGPAVSRRDDRSRCRSSATTTSRSPRPSYFHSLADGEVPLVFHFNGSVYLPRPGRPAADRPDLLGGVGRLPDAGRGLAGDDRRPLPAPRPGSRRRTRRSSACAASSWSRACPSFDAALARLLER